MRSGLSRNPLPFMSLFLVRPAPEAKGRKNDVPVPKTFNGRSVAEPCV
jgi:hypothetical protein